MVESIKIPASLTCSEYVRKRRYKSKTSDKVIKYKVIEKRIALRIHSAGFGNKLRELKEIERGEKV